MGIMVVHGARAGGFSPISIYGSITNDIVEKSELPGSPLTLFSPASSSTSRSRSSASSVSASRPSSSSSTWGWWPSRSLWDWH